MRREERCIFGTSYNGEVPKDIARASISLNVRGAGGSSTDLDLNVLEDINS